MGEAVTNGPLDSEVAVRETAPSARSVWATAAELTERGESFVVVTLTQTRGHAPQDPGAKAVITAHGIVAGTVGGGKVEARAIRAAQTWLGTRTEATPTGADSNKMPADAPVIQSGDTPRIVTWNLQRDVGMTCGGEVTALFEIHRADQWPIVIFGAGHVAQALVRVLAPLRCQITVIDSRPEWIERLPSLPHLQTHVAENPSSLVRDLDPRAFFVVMTQGHATDMPILRELFERHPQAHYLGAIGSDVKALKIRAELKALGWSDDLIARLHCPIGLPIGNNDPAEIALSVAAELLQVRDQIRAGSATNQAG